MSLELVGEYAICLIGLRGWTTLGLITDLSVTEFDPVCGSNASDGTVAEGEHLRMWCMVNYWGNLDLVMEWSRNDESSVVSTTRYSNDIFFSTATSTSYETMNRNEHSAVYLCKTYFKKPIVHSREEGSSTATNAPGYNAECKVIINVLRKLYGMYGRKRVAY